MLNFIKKTSIFSLCFLIFLTGCSQKDDLTIKKLATDLEEYKLLCNNNYCDEVKNKVVQVIDFWIEDYKKILVDNDGNVYLYDSTSFNTSELKKVTDKIKIKYIENIIEAYDYEEFYLIYSGGKYYSLRIKNENYIIEEYKTFDNSNKYYYYNASENPIKFYSASVVGVSKTGQPVRYDYGVGEFSTKKASFGVDGNLNKLKAKYYNGNLYATEEGELYEVSYKNDDESNIFKLYDFKLLLSDIDNLLIYPTSFYILILCQTSDNHIHYYRASDKGYNISKESDIPIPEKIEKIYLDGYNLIVIGEENVYFVNDIDEYEVIKLDGLKKYKNEIRGFFIFDTVNVLLSDGNFYIADYS